MGFTEGFILIVVAIVLIFLGRAGGPVTRFMQVYIVGQIYVMTAMTMGVIGVAFMIVNWPF
jgi:hypothetical protein